MVGYKYEFDNTTVGDARYDRGEYETVQDALKILEAKLSAWNQVAMENGALEPPYAREVKDLQNIIEWGQERLSNQATDMVRVLGISVGSTRYLKAALIHAAWFREKEINQTAKDTWPSAVTDAMRGRVRKYHQFAEEISQPPAAILEELRPEYGMTTPRSDSDTSWDAFVSHASEDKEPFVRALAGALRARDLRVWYGIGAEGIRRFSPMLADRVAISSDAGVATVVDALIAAMRS